MVFTALLPKSERWFMPELIYRIVHNADEYQYFLPENPDDYAQFNAACKPLKEIWTAPAVIIYEPFHIKGDFFQPNQACLVLSPRALDIVGDFLATMGEVLPLSYQGETYGFVNILNCYDCLDTEKSTWLPGFEEILVKDYSFRQDRLPELVLFKIPQTHVSEILLHAHTTEKHGFKQIVEANKLTGIDFQIIWESAE
jgi:hypothetical protein